MADTRHFDWEAIEVRDLQRQFAELSTAPLVTQREQVLAALLMQFVAVLPYVVGLAPEEWLFCTECDGGRRPSTWE